MVAMTGREMGSTNWVKMRNCRAPSILPDSMMLSGIVVWKNVRMTTT